MASVGTSTALGTKYSNQNKLVRTTANLLVLFADIDGEVQYKTSTDNGTTWGSWIVAYNDNTVVSFSVYIENDDDILLVVQCGTTLDFRTLTYSGGTWFNGTVYTVEASARYSPVITKRSNGDICIAAIGASSYFYYYYSTDAGQTWNKVTQNALYTTYVGDIWMLPYGSDIWVIVKAASQNVTRYTFDTTYKSAGYITTTGLASVSESIAGVKEDDSNIWVALATTSGIKVFYWNGSSWDGGTLLSDNSSDISPTMALVANEPAVIWRDYDGSQFDIAYRIYNGSSWDAQVDITSDATSDNYPTALESDTANLYFAWTKGNSSPYDIYFNVTLFTTEVLSDIINDFRTLKLWSMDDIVNDFRMVSNILRYDIINDIRISGIAIIDIINDMRTLPSNTLRYDINNKMASRLQVLYDLANKFNLMGENLSDINNKVGFLELSESDVLNFFNMVNSYLTDINNDVRFQKYLSNDVYNDFRMVADFQIPGDYGFQSLGKEYIKVYIDDVEQTDVDVDSIGINRVLNDNHMGSFNLGRAYDSTKPTMEGVVEIKYHIWTLYKGYVVDIQPTDSPESIKVLCNNNHWKRNKENKYFLVGHKPTDDKETYYNTIKEALLTEFSWDLDIGNFIPQTMNLFGTKESNAITQLIQNSGNYGWYYDVNGNKKLWRGGEGSIIKITRQAIGTNMGLHQAESHSFRESVENIVNKYRVQMGEIVEREFDTTSGVRNTGIYYYLPAIHYPIPAWDQSLETLAKNSIRGYGWDYHTVDTDVDYSEVFRKYALPTGDYSNIFSPLVVISKPYSLRYSLVGGRESYLSDGFTIDYENNLLIFNDAQYCYTEDSYGHVASVRTANIKLYVYRRYFAPYILADGDDPESDTGNDFQFFTEKIGDYTDTVMEVLNLQQLSIQQGLTYTDINGETVVIPSWDDTEFARDYANWQLSKTADKKYMGQVTITLDCFLYNAIDLSKRIMIDGVLDNALNITNIDIDINNWLVTLQLESFRAHKRTVSFQSRGE